MPKLKYVGPHDAVDIPGAGTVNRGDDITVPDDLARGLRDREDFAPVTKKES